MKQRNNRIKYVQLDSRYLAYCFCNKTIQRNNSLILFYIYYSVIRILI